MPCDKLLIYNKKMVGVAGFEPATPSSRTTCATRLRYTPSDGFIHPAVGLDNVLSPFGEMDLSGISSHALLGF